MPLMHRIRFFYYLRNLQSSFLLVTIGGVQDVKCVFALISPNLMRHRFQSRAEMPKKLAPAAAAMTRDFLSRITKRRLERKLSLIMHICRSLSPFRHSSRPARGPGCKFDIKKDKCGRHLLWPFHLDYSPWRVEVSGQ